MAELIFTGSTHESGIDLRDFAVQRFGEGKAGKGGRGRKKEGKDIGEQW
jgi:hypothetical protein